MEERFEIITPKPERIIKIILTESEFDRIYSVMANYSDIRSIDPEWKLFYEINSKL